MARRIKDYQFGSQSGRATVYPWKKWTDGSKWKVVHGKDFHCTPGSFIVYLYNVARKRELSVQTSRIRGSGRTSDKVVFQFRQRNEVPVEKKKLKRK